MKNANIKAYTTERSKRWAKLAARRAGTSLSAFAREAIEERARQELRRTVGEGVASAQVGAIVVELWPREEDKDPEQESGPDGAEDGS